MPKKPKPRQLLVIGAHPDDETFGCAGTIALETKQGNNSTICCLTGSRDRHKELQAACKILGAKVIAHEAEDLTLTIPQVSKLIIPLIQDLRPEVIITHCLQDYHPDHRIVYEGVLQAAEWAGHATIFQEKAWRPHRILTMEINNLLPSPNIIVDISEIIDLKRQAIIAYKTQMTKTEGYYMTFNLQKARLRGIQGGCEFAEAFQEILMPIHGPFYSPAPTVKSVFR